jgi:hypothetical protein
MPTSALPIDARSMFTDMDEMREAAMSAVEAGSCDSNYYFGQLLTYKSPDSTEVYTYKVVNKPEYYNLMSIATLTPPQIDEIVERVLESPKVIKIGQDIDILSSPKPDSGLVYNSDNGLRVNLTPNSGLHLTEDGLEIETSDEGNVKLTNTENGLKGEFCWNIYDEE